MTRWPRTRSYKLKLLPGSLRALSSKHGPVRNSWCARGLALIFGVYHGLCVAPCKTLLFQRPNPLFPRLGVCIVYASPLKRFPAFCLGRILTDMRPLTFSIRLRANAKIQYRGIILMKKAGFLLPLFLLFAIPMTGQIEHAPTPAQCRADVDSWGIPTWSSFGQNEVQFDNYSVKTIRDHSVTAKALEARITELGQCMKTDKVLTARYSHGQRAYAIAELARMAEFMKRHGLQAQFYQEDEHPAAP
jgi:hypothetical protein